MRGRKRSAPSPFRVHCCLTWSLPPARSRSRAEAQRSADTTRWIENCSERIKSSAGRRLLEAGLNQSPTAWWQAVPGLVQPASAERYVPNTEAHARGSRQHRLRQGAGPRPAKCASSSQRPAGSWAAPAIPCPLPLHPLPLDASSSQTQAHTVLRRPAVGSLSRWRTASCPRLTAAWSRCNLV